MHGLPAGLRSEAVLNAVGGFIGRVVLMDERNFDGSMRIFFRIRIELEVTKPLKKGMRIKKDDGEWVRVEFKYERLPTFCFICGVLGHGDRFCHKRGHGVHAVTEKQYGPELRAGGRRNAPMRGQTWVAPETVVERREWAAPGARVQNDINGNSSQNILSNSLAMQVHDSFTETSHGKSVNHNESSSTKHMTTSRDSLVSHEGIILLYDQKRKRAQNEDNNTEAGEGNMDVDTIVSKNLSLAGAGVA